MEEMIFIKPAPGLIVRDPVSRAPLEADGEVKPRDIYWLRRLNDGDVLETKPPKLPKEEVSK